MVVFLCLFILNGNTELTCGKRIPVVTGILCDLLFEYQFPFCFLVPDLRSVDTFIVLIEIYPCVTARYDVFGTYHYFKRSRIHQSIPVGGFSLGHGILSGINLRKGYGTISSRGFCL